MSKTDYDDTMNAGDRIDKLTRLFSEQQAEIASLQSQLAEARERERQMREAVRDFRDASDMYTQYMEDNRELGDRAFYGNPHKRARSEAEDKVWGVVIELFPPEAT